MGVDCLVREDREGLCILTLNRPEKRNALNAEIFERLDAELASIEQSTETIGCVVLVGAGPSFCAGADLAATLEHDPLPFSFRPSVVERLANLPQPVVAKVRGHCLTGGLELALAADIIVASASSRFGDTHAKWGFVGIWGMSQRLPRRVGASFAKLMMFSARMLDGPEALRVGLADICVPDAELDGEVDRLVGDILGNSWHTSRAAKRMVRETDGMTLAQGLAHEHAAGAGHAPDWRERVGSFRAPAT